MRYHCAIASEAIEKPSTVLMGDVAQSVLPFREKRENKVSGLPEYSASSYQRRNKESDLIFEKSRRKRTAVVQIIA